MKLIKLTFFKPPHKYGGSGGATTKNFYFNPLTTVSMIPYTDSTKITDITGTSFEVCESITEIVELIKNKN